MKLTAGDRIGPYEVLGAIGAGGMGEVYRARDSRLQRDVALKVLPDAVAADADRLARFEREARVLAALNHPNIAQIYGFEESGIVRALVMELVEGEDLSAVIARGAVPLAEALPIGRQIAEALEAAHEAGIVHRDLKPANVKIRGDGTVKVLDFGLAKAAAADPGSDASAGGVTGDSPTMTSPAMTQMGIILGTAAYMSPEQARGKTVDRRADIWAFGVVLFEMLSGAQLFTGETMTDMFAALLRQDVDWTLLPAATPDSVRRLLARCLDRDVKKRLQAIGEARLVFEEAAAEAVAAAPRASARTSASAAAASRNAPIVEEGARARRRLPWPRIAVLTIAAIATVALAWRLRTRSATDAAAISGAPSGRSIAVLPFVNSSGSPDDEYLADGMTDELIASLGKVPGLKVAARSSVFSFKGQKAEVREVARRLGVDTVLEGTIRRSGKRMRVTASLVSASDGLQLWSSTFENEGGDAFAVQDEVTRGVVSGLSLQLAGSALTASQAGRTKDPEAHDLYLRGLASSNAGSEANLRRALDYYQQALDRDPQFALAYAGIAWVHAFLADAYVAPKEAYPRVRAAAQAAIERDDQVADAHALLAYSTFSLDWGATAEADREFARALAIDPNSVNTLALQASYKTLVGRFDEGIVDGERAARLDPLSPIPPLTIEIAHFASGDFRGVIEAHRRTAAIDPSFVYVDTWVGAAYRELGDYPAALREYTAATRSLGGAPMYGLALTYHRMGRDAEAKEIMRDMDARASRQYVPLCARAAVHEVMGDHETAVDLVRQSVDARELHVMYVRVLVEMKPLIQDPRVRKLLDEVDAKRKRP